MTFLKRTFFDFLNFWRFVMNGYFSALLVGCISTGIFYSAWHLQPNKELLSRPSPPSFLREGRARLVVFLITPLVSYSVLLYMMHRHLSLIPFAVFSYGWLLYLFARLLKERPMMSCIFACTVSVFWLIYQNPILLSIVSGIVCISAIAIFGVVSFRKLVWCSVVLVLLDMYAVWGNHHMEALAAMLEGTPSFISIFASFNIGAGDIIFSGFIVLCAFQKNVKANSAYPLLPIGAMAGFVVGLLVANFALDTFRYPQPATLYLLPGAFIGLLIAATFYGITPKMLWREKT